MLRDLLDWGDLCWTRQEVQTASSKGDPGGGEAQREEGLPERPAPAPLSTGTQGPGPPQPPDRGARVGRRPGDPRRVSALLGGPEAAWRPISENSIHPLMRWK